LVQPCSIFLWQMMRLGMEEQVLNSRTFWLYTVYKSCQVRCPQGIALTDTMVALKEYATHKGINVPTGMQILGETVTAKYNISGDDTTSRQIGARTSPLLLLASGPGVGGRRWPISSAVSASSILASTPSPSRWCRCWSGPRWSSPPWERMSGAVAI